MDCRLCTASRTWAPVRATVFAFAVLLAIPSFAQDWIRTGTGLGVEKVRLAASDFKPTTPDPKNPDLLKACLLYTSDAADE